MAIYIIGGIVVLISLFLVRAERNNRIYNRRVNAWAKSIPLTESQQNAMWELWQSFKARQIPTIDPLSKLSKENREYILRVCSTEVFLREFYIDYDGSIPISIQTVRLASYISAVKKGYTKEQAAVITGMTFNHVGRKDI